MTAEAILVVDLGTTKAHVNLFAVDDGRLLRNSEVSYEWMKPGDGMAELHAETVWEAAQDAVARIVEQIGEIRIAALTFSFFGAELVTLDQDKNEVFPVIISFDNRAAAEAEEIRKTVSPEQISCIVRGGINEEANPSKILWLKKHYPERFRKIRYATTIAQYIYHKLGLPFCTERSMLHTLQFFRQDCSLISELAAVCGLSAAHFDYPVYDGDSAIGRVKSFGRVGFPYEVPVLPGGHDCILSQLGSGVLPEKNGILGNVCGTYDIMGFLVPAETVRGRDEECLTTPFAETLSFMYGGPTGARLAACVERLWGNCSGELLSRLFDISVFDGEHGGLWTEDDWETIKNDPASLQKYGEQRVFESLIEEITFGLKEDLWLVLNEKNEKPFNVVRAGGGASRSENWIQLKADVFGTDFEIVENGEVSSLGAAVIAAVAAGCFPGYPEALEAMVHVSKRFTPQRADRYEALYHNWKERR